MVFSNLVLPVLAVICRFFDVTAWQPRFFLLFYRILAQSCGVSTCCKQLLTVPESCNRFVAH